MAVMSSTYWGVMCAGRMLWTVLSGVVTSTWPMLFFDVGACFVASLLLLLCRAVGAASRLFEPILWLAAMGLGLGVASGLPCVYSLPPEAQVPMTPWSITILNAASTLGETCFPYVIGLAFDRQAFWALGGLMSFAMGLALTVSLFSWRRAVSVIYSRRLNVDDFEVRMRAFCFSLSSRPLYVSRLRTQTTRMRRDPRHIYTTCAHGPRTPHATHATPAFDPMAPSS